MIELASLTQHVSRRPQRIALLERIAEQGSITRAAKAAGMSYKAAWDAIDEMNNLAGIALVSRSVGGKGGGGARLTEAGERLLALHRRLHEVQTQLLALAEDDGDLARLSRLLLRTSARNQLVGEVVAIEPQGHHERVTLQLPGGQRLQALITPDSRKRLELRPGVSAIALFKAGALKLVTPDTPCASENRLHGVVARIDRAEGGPSEVSIRLAGEQTLCALLEAPFLDLRPDGEVIVQVAPEQILLGTTL
ncbi:TOBE domain-containing protein [Stutzerimonas urumqiensis]|uniref:TOBE domain-containing protein n=1 Tax=Stutzerimonas urumqiensis TaxID=638269 RepID=UPI003DA49B57